MDKLCQNCGNRRYQLDISSQQLDVNLHNLELFIQCFLVKINSCHIWIAVCPTCQEFQSLKKMVLDLQLQVLMLSQKVTVISLLLSQKVIATLLL